MSAPRGYDDDDRNEPDENPRLDYEFSVKRRKVKEINFTIGGYTSAGELDKYVYHFTPPKRTIMVEKILTGEEMDEADAMSGTIDWLSSGLREGEPERILDRLRDVHDDLDVEDLMEITQSLAGGQAGRPTTSRRGLRR